MTTKKIEKLTDEQMAALRAFADRWIADRLRPGVADRPRVEAAIREHYRIAGLDTDVPIVWCPSPMACARRAPIAAALIDAGVSRADLPGAVLDVVEGRRQIEHGKPIWAPAWRDGLWSSYMAFVEAARDVLGVEIPASYDATYGGLVDAGPWIPLRGVVLASERHCTAVGRDAAGRLHCETGAAIAWPDGWGVYAWHGTRVPREWITDRAALDPRTALTHPNIEQRRAAAEIIGWSKVLAAVGAKTIHKDRDPEIGELLEADLPDAPASRFLRVRCGTGREFVLPVPSTVKTAREANAWTYGIDAADLKPEVRT